MKLKQNLIKNISIALSYESVIKFVNQQESSQLFQ